MTLDPRNKFPRPGAKENPQDYPGWETKMVTKPDYGKLSYKGNERLKGKTALITGGDSGIGRSVALAFAREGAEVVINYLPEEQADAEALLSLINKEGGRAKGIAGDLSDEGFCKSLVDETVNEFGKIDILVNNAALQRYFKSIDKIKGDDFAQIYQVNVIAPFVLSMAALKHMKPGSSIINTVSIQAYEPSSLLLPYATSKSALVALTKALAQELLEKGIRVNAVAPGPIWSPLNTHGSPTKKLKKFGEKSLFGRPGQPIELAPVYVLLASDEASYITGEIYGITGGSGIA
jgi:hypothetical protein